jgi:hypothetical protein
MTMHPKIQTILGIFGIVFIILLVASAGLAGYVKFALPQPPVITFTELPAMKTLYTEYRGDCNKFTDQLPGLATKVTESGSVCESFVAQFGGNATLIGDGNLYCRVGCVLPTLPKVTPKGLQVEEIPARTYVQAPLGKKSAIHDIRDRLAIVSEIQKSGAINNGMTLVLLDLKRNSTVSDVFIPVHKLLPLQDSEVK